MENLVVIPARGGSKGIAGKNIKNIAGKPLIAWTIEQAIKARCIDRVIVTTDCKEIASISRNYGAETPFTRPSELAGDTATTESAILHAIGWLEENEDYKADNIILLQATSPIRADNAIDEAFHTFTESKADSLLSVSEFWHFLWENQSNPRALYNFKKRPRRQDICSQDIKLKENGSIYITKTSALITEKNRLAGKISTYIMPEDHSFEIDTPIDWCIVEAIMNKVNTTC